MNRNLIPAAQALEAAKSPGQAVSAIAVAIEEAVGRGCTGIQFKGFGFGFLPRSQPLSDRHQEVVNTLIAAGYKAGVSHPNKPRCPDATHPEPCFLSVSWSEE